MTSDPHSIRERADAEFVDRAVQALIADDVQTAESLLLQVVENTPAEYSNFEELEDGVAVKFWDQEAFLHYVMWMQKCGQADHKIEWIKNAYPRAYFHLGFLCIKQERFADAIEFLDRGLLLEPDNPKFISEKAQALIHLGLHEAALPLYESIEEPGPFTTMRDLAVAQRGRGFLYVEMGDLDKAEAAFITSLKLEPENRIAVHELRYIAHLRSGGLPAPMESTITNPPDFGNCGVCGQKIQRGVVVAVRGTPVMICNRCKRKLTKKWWQFWK